MPVARNNLYPRPSSSATLDRSERARRRSVTHIASPTSSHSPPLSSALLPILESPFGVESVNSEQLSLSSTAVTTPRIPSPSSSDSSISSVMSRNISGSGWVDMGSLKSGCQLLVPNPSLDALEELWGYVTCNLEDRNITDVAVKKKEFIRCFAKWCNLKDVLAEISLQLVEKSWIELDDSSADPDDFVCRPFFDTIRDKILGKDWARTYDLKRDKFVMLADPLGFSKLVTLMETHNRRLRGTMYHRSNEVLQALIMQKLPDKFRADLRDCKVSEQLPYAEWKAACKDVEERRPPTAAVTTYAGRRGDARIEKPVFTSGAGSNYTAAPSAPPSLSTSRSHRFPKIQPEQKKLLYRVEACFRCYNLFAGHLGSSCPNNGPPALSVPYRPLNEEDITLANKIHDAAPNNSIPYELILKKNAGPSGARPVAVIRDRIALTELPDLDDAPEASAFTVQSRGVAAIYGSRDVVRVASGPDVYGSALNYGLSYHDSISAPVSKPVATLVPTRRGAREYYDDAADQESPVYSPSRGRNTRRRDFSPVGPRRASNAIGQRSPSRSQSPSTAGEDGHDSASDVPQNRSRRALDGNLATHSRGVDTASGGSSEHTRARSAPSKAVATSGNVLGNVCWEA
ncbi:hypothetical protein F5890DRAFT_1478896 [Lentinula detonsa]|uniref:Uncharacterized protein n=1 Tax=Lentinula detonsa TaxID=2804962 RepID=A0AA38UPE6_9AGAR|nr:hypothetical protein F5890DRAFT_1478896 [Lentinula detonsa]